MSETNQCPEAYDFLLVHRMEPMGKNKLMLSGSYVLGGPSGRESKSFGNPPINAAKVLKEIVALQKTLRGEAAAVRVVPEDQLFLEHRESILEIMGRIRACIQRNDPSFELYYLEWDLTQILADPENPVAKKHII
jgi:hypothetical protein